jgi:hypothetical protein
MPPIVKGGSDEDAIQALSDYTKTPIKLYNNLFEETRHFEPSSYNYKRLGHHKNSPYSKTDKYFHNGVKLYEIQRVGNHCVALLNRKHINKVLPEFEHKDIQPAVSNPKLTDKIINKNHLKHIPHKFNAKIAAWDIETSKDFYMNHVPYACSIAWMDGGKQQEKQFWGLDCMSRFLEFLHKDESFNGYTLYAHNGGKYDIPLLMKYGASKCLGSNGSSGYFKNWEISGNNCIELNNSWIGFQLNSLDDPKNHCIKFKDSLRILPMGLEKLCKELKVKHQKLTETISHDDITLENYHTFPALKTYLSHDVKGLLECMLIFNKSVFEDLGIDVTTCFTGASLSKTTFFRNYYDQKKYPVYSLSDDHDAFIRGGYFGGRVECFKMGQIKTAFYYDFTSLYPDVGRQHLPYGEPVEVPMGGGAKMPAGFFGFVKCLVKTKNKNAIPKHALIKDGRLTFPIFKNWTPLDCFSQEVDYDMYEYQFESGLQFQKATFMNKFFTDGFQKKAQAKADGQPAMAQCHKIIINSGYGFWGLRTQNRDGVIICNKDNNDYMEYLNTEKLVNFKENEDGTLFCRVLKDLKVKDFNVGVASAIASYARLKLHALLTAIKDVGGSISYCDTDSVICDINLNDYPDIKSEFQWDGSGSELGSLKNECDEVVEKQLKKIYPGDKPKQKRVFGQLVQAENGNLSFDTGLIEGCKMYALNKTVQLDGKTY